MLTRGAGGPLSDGAAERSPITRASSPDSVESSDRRSLGGGAMTFTHPHGTHGRRQPRGPLMRLGNRMMSRRVRRAGGRTMMGMHLLVLHTIGAKSGEPRQTPVAWFPG